MTDTIILDLDGPLLDGIDRHYACYSCILRENGFQPIGKDKYWAQKRAGVDRRELLAQSGAGDFYDEFLDRWLATIEAPDMLALDRLQPNVLSILTEWNLADLQLILATMRNDRANTTGQLQQLSLEPLFDRILITGSSDSGGKSYAVRTHLQRSLNLAGRAVWIGDTEVDIRAAKHLGIPVYAVTCGLRDERQLLQHDPDFLLRDLTEVRNAIAAHIESRTDVA